MKANYLFVFGFTIVIKKTNIPAGTEPHCSSENFFITHTGEIGTAPEKICEKIKNCIEQFKKENNEVVFGKILMSMGIQDDNEILKVSEMIKAMTYKKLKEAKIIN